MNKNSLIITTLLSIVLLITSLGFSQETCRVQVQEAMEAIYPQCKNNLMPTENVNRMIYSCELLGCENDTGTGHCESDLKTLASNSLSDLPYDFGQYCKAIPDSLTIRLAIECDWRGEPTEATASSDLSNDLKTIMYSKMSDGVQLDFETLSEEDYTEAMSNMAKFSNHYKYHSPYSSYCQASISCPALRESTIEMAKAQGVELEENHQEFISCFGHHAATETKEGPHKDKHLYYCASPKDEEFLAKIGTSKESVRAMCIDNYLTDIRPQLTDLTQKQETSTSNIQSDLETTSAVVEELGQDATQEVLTTFSTKLFSEFQIILMDCPSDVIDDATCGLVFSSFQDFNDQLDFAFDNESIVENINHDQPWSLAQDDYGNRIYNRELSNDDVGFTISFRPVSSDSDGENLVVIAPSGGQ